MKLTRRDFSLMAAAAAALSRVPGALAQNSEHTKDPLFINLDQVKWELDDPKNPDSGGIAILRVDPVTQATQLLIRNPPGEYVPRHWHSANETNTVIRGNYIFECDGKKMEQGPGSFNYIPARMIHRLWCKSGEPGLDFITVDGKWDINWVNDPDAPKK